MGLGSCLDTHCPLAFQKEHPALASQK
jgi:hypothetical protein